MTPHEIRKRRQVIAVNIDAARLLLEEERFKLKALQSACKHPAMTRYSAMGELGNYCPDCGYQD